MTSWDRISSDFLSNLPSVLKPFLDELRIFTFIDIQDSSSVIRLTGTPNLSLKFQLHLSEDPEAGVSGAADVCAAHSERAEAALFGRIPVDRRLCAARLRG